MNAVGEEKEEGKMAEFLHMDLHKDIE